MAKKQKKQIVEKTPEIALKVIHDCFSEETSEVDPNDRWSCASTASTWDVRGLALCGAKDYPDVTACFPVEPGDGLYLVYVVYSTGDTFGHYENSTIIFVDVYKDEKKAERAARDIRQHYDWAKARDQYWKKVDMKKHKKNGKKYDNNLFSVDLVRESGEVNSQHAGWTGYFESLSYVEVVQFDVDANKRQRY